MAIAKKQSRSWWFSSHNNPRNSSWLSSALQELDKKTKAILELIEEDADSFMQCTELYDNKRPQLINIIKDFYLAHSSLAQQYDKLKLEFRTHQNTHLDLSIRCLSDKLNRPIHESSKSSSGLSDSEESEVCEPELEIQAEIDMDVPEDISVKDAVKLMNEKIERLKVENEMLKAEVKAKDEEKREVIRQLSFPIGILVHENATLKKCIREESEKWGFLGFKNIKNGILSCKLFGKH